MTTSYILPFPNTAKTSSPFLFSADDFIFLLPWENWNNQKRTSTRFQLSLLLLSYKYALILFLLFCTLGVVSMLLAMTNACTCALDPPPLPAQGAAPDISPRPPPVPPFFPSVLDLCLLLTSGAYPCPAPRQVPLDVQRGISRFHNSAFSCLYG